MRVMLPIGLILLTLSATGCGKTYDLGPEWAPLEQIRESRVVAAGVGAGGARTIGETVYVKELDAFFAENPQPQLTALLKHEQVHAQRQKAKGLYTWLGLYLTDRDFAWDEEQRGWYVELTYLRSRGLRVIPEAVAEALAGYVNAKGKIVDYDDALAWAKAVVNGTWHPDNESE